MEYLCAELILLNHFKDISSTHQESVRWKIGWVMWYIIKDTQLLYFNKMLKGCRCSAGSLWTANRGKQKVFNEKSLMETLLKHTVNSLVHRSD